MINEMSDTPEIIVKYACPTFTYEDIVGAIGEEETVERACKYLEADRPYDWHESCRIIQELDSRLPCLGSVDGIDLIHLLRCVAPLYEIHEDAVYIRGYNAHKKRKPHENKSMFHNKYMNNMCELEYIVKNRVLQYLVGVWATRSYIQFLSRLSNLDNIVIMLYGTSDFTVCLYTNVSLDDIALIESNLMDSSQLTLEAANADDFLSWAFPIIPRKKTGYDADLWDQENKMWLPPEEREGGNS